MLLIACAQPVESPAPDKHHTHQKAHNFQSVGSETTEKEREGEGERERELESARAQAYERREREREMKSVKGQALVIDINIIILYIYIYICIYIYIYIYITLYMTDTYFTFNLGSRRDEGRQYALVIFQKFPTKQQLRDAFAVNSPEIFFKKGPKSEHIIK